ncbi:MAG: DivIVA domain-containing protein [Acidimicrobiales bacterium]
MAISSKEVREVEFRERMRGYHQEDVDEFLEQVARGIEVLEEQLREAQAKVANLSRGVVTPSQTPQAAARPIEAPDDTIQRTLLLAQRTADQVIADANDQAGALMSEAREQSQRLIQEARAQADALLEEKSRLIASEVEALEARRGDLLREVGELADRSDQVKDTLKVALARFIADLDSSMHVERVDLPADSSVAESASSLGVGSSYAETVVESSDGDSVSFEDHSGEFDRTMIFPPSSPEGEPDMSFGRPDFQVLEGDGPSAPVLFDDEDARPDRW